MTRLKPLTRKHLVAALSGAALLIAVSALLFSLGSIGGRSLDPAQLAASEPPAVPALPVSRSATPVSGATPDVTKPYWWVPYQNAEDMKPRFRGEINGIQVGTQDGPVPECEDGFGAGMAGQKALDALEGTPFEINTSGLPRGVVLDVDSVELVRCADGSPYRVYASLHARGEAPRFGELIITIDRHVGLTWWPDLGSADLWSAETVAGRPAAVKGQVLPGLWGSPMIIVRDDEVDGSTRFQTGGAVPLPLLHAVVEAVYR